MANLIARANLALAAGNFNAVEAGANAFINSEAGTTDTTTSYVYDTACTVTNLDSINGIALLLQRLGTTGTFSVALSDDNGTTATREVTVNCSDLPTERSWVFFKFSSPLVGDGGTDYRVGIKSSTATQVRVYGDGSRRSRVMALDATAVAGAADVLFIVGEWTAAGAGSDFTVTMDQTAATDYGAIIIGQRGILNWGTTAATNYLLRTSGIMKVFSGGSYRQGTVATPVPRDSTAILEFDCTSATEFGLENYGGEVIIQGLSRTVAKNIVHCKLNTDEAAAQLVLGADTDVGWLSGDEIGIASTTRTSTQFETRVLDGNATATTITVTVGLTNAHSGTSPTQAEVVLLTHNCKFRATNASFRTYFTNSRNAIVDVDWCEFRYLGSNTSNEFGIQFGATDQFIGTAHMKFFSFRDGFYIRGIGSANGGWTIEDFTSYNPLIQSTLGGVSVERTTETDWVVRRGIIMGGTGDSNGYFFDDIGGTIEDITVTSTPHQGIRISDPTLVPWTIDGLVIHSNATYGFYWPTDSVGGGTIRDFQIWRNNSASGQIFFNQVSVHDLTWENGLLFGGNTYNINVFGETTVIGLTWKNVTIAGDSTFATGTGIVIAGNGGICFVNEWRWINCTFGVASGIFVAHTAEDILFTNSVTPTTWTMIGCTLASTEEVDDYDLFWDNRSFILLQNLDGGATHKAYLKQGIIVSDTTIFTFGQKLTPTSATIKIDTSIRIPGRGFLVPVDAAQAATITAECQKDGSYNGNQPRLMVRANPLIGIADDTVLDTMTVGASTTEVLSGTTIAVTAKGVIEAFVDCDGTVGNLFVGEFGAS